MLAFNQDRNPDQQPHSDTAFCGHIMGSIHLWNTEIALQSTWISSMMMTETKLICLLSLSYYACYFGETYL